MLKELIKSILIYGVASSAGRFIGLLLVPVYTRVFNPGQYGVIDLVATVVAFVSILGMAQLESAISRYYFAVKDEEERRLYVSTAFWTITGVSVLCAALVLVLAEHISSLLFETRQYGSVVIVGSLIIPVSNLFSFLAVLMRYIKKPLVYTVFIALQMLSTVCISVWLVAYEGVGVIGVFYGQLFGFLLAACAMVFYLRFLVGYVWSWDVLKKLFRYSLPMVPGVCGGWLNFYANRFFMLGYLTLADIGLYTVALKIASLFRLLDSAFRMAWGPFMWEHFERPGHQEIYRSVMKVVTAGVFMLVLLTALFSDEITAVLTTEEYANASPLIGILAFSIALTIVGQVVWLGPAIRKRTEYNSLAVYVSVGVNILLLYILVPAFGLMAVPICMLVSSTLSIVLGWFISERLYYVGFSKAFFEVGYVITLVVVVTSMVIHVSLFLQMAFMTVAGILFLTMLATGGERVLRVPPLRKTAKWLGLRLPE